MTIRLIIPPRNISYTIENNNKSTASCFSMEWQLFYYNNGNKLVHQRQWQHEYQAALSVIALWYTNVRVNIR